MSTVDAERKALQLYERLLEQATGRRVAADQEERSLTKIVESISQRLLANGASQPSEQQSPSRAAAPAVTVDRSDLEPSRGAAAGAGKRRPLITAIAEIMSDGKTRNVEEICASLRELDEFPGGKRARQTVTNRLHELRQSGYLEHLERGVYRPAANADAARALDARRRAPEHGAPPPAQASSGKSTLAGGDP
jgi:hypothetical protein